MANTNTQGLRVVPPRQGSSVLTIPATTGTYTLDASQSGSVVDLGLSGVARTIALPAATTPGLTFYFMVPVGGSGAGVTTIAAPAAGQIRGFVADVSANAVNPVAAVAGNQNLALTAATQDFSATFTSNGAIWSVQAFSVQTGAGAPAVFN